MAILLYVFVLVPIMWCMSLLFAIGSPVVFSQPHFLDADPSIIHSVDGVNPNREEHSTLIDVEPVSYSILE